MLISPHTLYLEEGPAGQLKVFRLLTGRPLTTEEIKTLRLQPQCVCLLGGQSQLIYGIFLRNVGRLWNYQTM